MNESLNNVTEVTNSHTELMKTMTYKSIYLEARYRRINLVFRCFIEHYGEDCFGMLREFLKHRLDIDPTHVYIARAQRHGERNPHRHGERNPHRHGERNPHRHGERNPHRQHNSRPMIANCRDFCDIETIMSIMRILKGSPFSVDYNYPREIQETRSKLWPTIKKISKVQSTDSLSS